jgi:hypothetical protein
MIIDILYASKAYVVFSPRFALVQRGLAKPLFVAGLACFVKS